MVAEPSGAVSSSVYWGLEHPWKGGAFSWKVLAAVLAVLLILIFFAHDGVRIAKEHS